MNTNDTNRQKAHAMIDHIFKDLLPAQGMVERSEQIKLSHRMLDTMLNGGIALCDAGTGIGKTYAYLAAAAAANRSDTEALRKPVIISTSSIALQNAVQTEYLPLLSCILLADGQIDRPLLSVIRKGKGHYVCDERLQRRLRQVNFQKKDPAAADALRALKGTLDMDNVPHLSGYDRERVCVPQFCDCDHQDCRYKRFLKRCDADRYVFQICNHNLLLADAIHRSQGKRPIFPEHSVIIVDEAHKLPEAAREMFGMTLTTGDIQSMIHQLRAERYLLATEPGGLREPWDFLLVEGEYAVPLVLQLLLVELIIDVLKLASLNTPDVLGNSFSMLGALILGDFAVQSRWLVPEVLVYMAFVAVSNFAQHSFEMGYACKLCRMALVLLAFALRWWGFGIGLLGVLALIATTKPIAGRGYLYPLIPWNGKALRSLLLRRPAHKDNT